jgi:hypothetical protein
MSNEDVEFDDGIVNTGPERFDNSIPLEKSRPVPKYILILVLVICLTATAVMIWRTFLKPEPPLPPTKNNSVIVSPSNIVE